MPNVKKISQGWAETGKTVYSVIRREADGYLLNDADGTFAAAPADPYVTLTEHATIKGLYELSESRASWNDGNYLVVAYKQSGGAPAPASDAAIGLGMMYMRNDWEITPSDIDADVDAIKAKTDALPADPASNAQVITRLAASNYTAPDNSGIAAILAEVITHPTLGEIEASTVLAKETSLSAHETARASMEAALVAEHDATQAAVGAVPTNPALATDYTPTRAAKLDSIDAGVAAVYAEAVTHPTLAEIEASTVLAKKADVLAITPISVLPFSGSVQVSYAQDGLTVEVIQGDSVSVPYDLAANLTGYTVWFGAKAAVSDAAYSIAVKEITASVTDVVNGRGLIPFTAVETNIAPAAYLAEIEIRKGQQVVTALRFKLKIKGQVIK